MSHEIRTPMTPILGYVDLLMDGELSLGEQATLLRTIKRNGEVLLQLINDILDLSKIEAGKMDTQRRKCSPWQVVEDVVSLMQVTAEDKGLDLMAKRTFPLPDTIHTDPTRLRQILVNLIGNAIKFTKDGGVRITVRCIQQKDAPARMQFVVADTGMGMTAEETTRLFEPFTQANASTTRHFGGTGLGLAISKRLAKLLGGDIEVETQPGKGSTFTLTIDPGSLEGIAMLQSSPNGQAKRDRPTQTSEEIVLSGRVLLAEDEQDIQRLVCLILKKAGLRVDVAENGRVAYDKALASESEGKPYDLILMDIRMPQLDGYEVARRLRRDGWDGPIVALTAQGMVGDHRKCLQAGCNGYLAKPMDQTELLATIARHLGQATSAQLVPAAGSTAAQPGLIGSTLIDGNEKAELLAEFLEGLSSRTDRIEEALRADDLETLARLAQQLKGSAGVYGFPQIAKAALVVQKQAAEQIEPRAAVAELVDLCERANAAKSDGS